MNDDRIDGVAAERERVTLAVALRELSTALDAEALPPQLHARVMAAAGAHDVRPVQAAPATAPVPNPNTAVAPLPAPTLAPATVAQARRRVKAARWAWPRWAAWSAWSGAWACATVLVGATVLMLQGAPQAPARALVAGAGGFVALVPAERWPSSEEAAAWLVSTELPGDRLAALGLPFDPAHAGDSVRAELLMRPSGEVLAVRLIR